MQNIWMNNDVCVWTWTQSIYVIRVYCLLIRSKWLVFCSQYSICHFAGIEAIEIIYLRSRFLCWVIKLSEFFPKCLMLLQWVCLLFHDICFVYSFIFVFTGMSISGDKWIRNFNDTASVRYVLEYFSCFHFGFVLFEMWNEIPLWIRWSIWLTL